ncbi:hypothetical protein cyc_00161 [Cyclospora cayetanensis]|uniref:Apoptosis-antagonizing transcription factor C-terminal domain-containing protein n=1 Tax=Cyclospora cayetanensis TaxID=88456 RepID=A0A1D3CXL9_9EIME|nr:hypothetical protein cyc_00161 [Cyclospora cayetanensis]
MAVKRRRQRQESSDDEIKSSSGSEGEERGSLRLKGGTPPSQTKRLRLDEGLVKRVRKVQRQQQQQQQQQHRLVLVGGDSGRREAQQQRKAQQVQLQQQLFAKLIGLRVSMNSALRLANAMPAIDVQQHIERQQGEGMQAAIAAVRSEAARTFALLHQLQQLLLQQSSLAAAFSAVATAEASAPAPAWEAGGNWQKRREIYFDGNLQDRVQGGEMDVWKFLGDSAFAQRLITRSKTFAVFHQPVSAQLRNIMEAEEAKLLSRSLRSCSRAGGKAACSDRHSATLRKREPCAVVGCTASQEPHMQYEDTEFYVDLLKSSVASGTAQMDATELAKEKELLKKRGREKAREVDRRASKGRKIRYKTIPQLEHFMAAEPWIPNADVLPGADDPLVVESLMRNLFATS